MAEQKHVLVVIGSDPKLVIDTTAFDAVAEATGMAYTQMIDPTFQDFIDQTRRIRTQYGVMPNVHFALHMNPQSMDFKDRAVTPLDISVHLTGVPVAFLAGCLSTAIGDDLGAVPYVLTLLEPIDHRAAKTFGQLFWMGIGYDYPPDESYRMALKRMPDVARFAYLHSHRFLSPRNTQT